jgi:hypothetical protein
MTEAERLPSSYRKLRRSSRSSRRDVTTRRTPEPEVPLTVTFPSSVSRVNWPPGSSFRVFSIRVSAKAVPAKRTRPMRKESGPGSLIFMTPPLY